MVTRQGYRRCKNPRMRILVATDRIGGLTSAQAGDVLAAGWPGASVTVVPVGTTGSGLVEALADLYGAESVTAIVSLGVGPGPESLEPELPVAVSTYPLGRAVANVLAAGDTPRQVVVDLTGQGSHDGGAGFLAALGATADCSLVDGVAGLLALRTIDLAPARALLADVELIGVVEEAELAQPLLGLRGITSLRGREAGTDPAEMLAVDASLERLAGLVADSPTRPGDGAAGGLGLAIRALGGRLTTGPALSYETERARDALSGADLVVTGCSVFDFATRGGGVVAAAARHAAEVLSPCIVVAGEVLVGGREMRTMGIEAAYPVRQSTRDRPTADDLTADNITADELLAAVTRVARTWSW